MQQTLLTFMLISYFGLLAVLIGSSIWVGWDSTKIGLRKYHSTLSHGPIMLAWLCVQFWLLVFPWYLVLKYKINHGQAELASEADNWKAQPLQRLTQFIVVLLVCAMPYLLLVWDYYRGNYYIATFLNLPLIQIALLGPVLWEGIGFPILLGTRSIIAWIIAIFVFVAPIFTCTRLLQPAMYEVYMMILQFPEERPNEVVQYCTGVIGQDAGNARFYVYRSMAYIQLEQYQKAIDDCNKAISINGQDRETYCYRAKAYDRLGEYQRAVDDAYRVPDTCWGRTGVYLTRGHAYLALGQYQKAIADSDSEINFDPEIARAYDIRGYAYEKLGQHNKAIEDCTRAISLAVEDLKKLNRHHGGTYRDLVEMYLHRAEAYENSGKYGLAREDRKKAAALHQSNVGSEKQ